MLLGADGEPAPGALERIAGEVRDADGVDVLIGDEAALIGDGRWVRWRKRAFQPEALPAIDQVGPVLVVGPRAAAILRAALDAVPRDLYAFALELLDHDLQTYAVPHVLALTPAARLPADGAIARAAIERLAARRGRRVTVAAGPATGVREVRWPLDDPPEVVAVIPSRTPALVARCLAAVHARTHYPALRVVVVDSSDEGSEMRRVVAEAPLAATCVPYPAGERFNYQRAVNLGADQAGGADVLFLNDDVEPLEPGWLTAMVELMTLPGVGIVGALLRHPDGRLQHAGVQIGEGFGHRYHDAPGDACGHRFELLVPGNVEAVTGACMLVRGEVLRQLDGHDERFVHVYGDVDLCFRAAERGWRTAWTPRAELEHLESASYGSELDSDDIRRFGDRWHRDRDQRPSRQVRI
jgi:GT2 family glycosyltransferase